jgi:CRISPR/Cas system CMR-associated protein Cmr3 (group 5 of RAMP superfamily)
VRLTDSTTLAYIAGFLDGDGSIFFQIVPRKDYRQKFQVRSSIAFYQKSDHAGILEWLKRVFGAGYIRYRKSGVSDYTVVEPKEVKRILSLLQPYVRLKRRHVELGLEILDRLEKRKSNDDFLEICRLVDGFRELNYSKKRTVTYATVSKSLPL